MGKEQSDSEMLSFARYEDIQVKWVFYIFLEIFYRDIKKLKKIWIVWSNGKKFEGIITIENKIILIKLGIFYNFL